MIWTTVILFLLWLFGIVNGAQLGGWIHGVLVLAITCLILAVIHRGGGAAVKAR